MAEAINEQMKMAFMDDGMERDPVSGNDIPTGSLAEEVRDDVPAMLSEGEFVFPADVVRYIGLNNLMNMRQEAKMGLKKMEAMGQMGNGDEATLPDDMPFGMADIVIVEGSDEPKEMAQGGVIQAQTGKFITPMFNPSDRDDREYKNAKGESLFIPFLNGQPVYPIPAGYSLVGQTPTETTPETPAPAEDDGGGGRKKPVVNEFTEAGSWAGSPLDMYIKEADKVTTYGNMASGVGAAFNPLIGGFMAVAVKNEKRKILSTIDARIEQAKTTEEKNELKDIKDRLTNPERKGILSKAINSVFDGVADSLGLSKEEQEVAKGTTKTVVEQKTDDTDAKTQKDIDDSINAAGTIDPTVTTVTPSVDESAMNMLDEEATPFVQVNTDTLSPTEKAIEEKERLLNQSKNINTRPDALDLPRTSGSLNISNNIRASIEKIKNPETALDEIDNVTSIIEKLEQENKDSLDEINKQTDTILKSAPAGVIAPEGLPTTYQAGQQRRGSTTKTTEPKGETTEELRKRLRKERKKKRTETTRDILQKSRDIQKEKEKTGKSIAEIGRERAPSSAAKSVAEKAKEEGDPRNMKSGGLASRKKK